MERSRAMTGGQVAFAPLVLPDGRRLYRVSTTGQRDALVLARTPSSARDLARAAGFNVPDSHVQVVVRTGGAVSAQES